MNLKFFFVSFMSIFCAGTYATEIPAWPSYPKKGLTGQFTYGFATPQAACANSVVPPTTSWQCSSPNNPRRTTADAACKDAMAAISPGLAQKVFTREAKISRAILCSTLTPTGSVYTAPGTCWISQVDPIPTEVGLTYNPGTGFCQTQDEVPIYNVLQMKILTCPGGGTWKLKASPPVAPTPTGMGRILVGYQSYNDSTGYYPNPPTNGNPGPWNGPLSVSEACAVHQPGTNVVSPDGTHCETAPSDGAGVTFGPRPVFFCPNGNTWHNEYGQPSWCQGYGTCPTGYVLDSAKNTCVAEGGICSGDCPGTQTINVDTFWCDVVSGNKMATNRDLLKLITDNQQTTIKWMQYNGGL